MYPETLLILWDWSWGWVNPLQWYQWANDLFEMLIPIICIGAEGGP